jgi:small subunit ribosomal protein S1
MPNPNLPESPVSETESTESFKDLLSQYEKSHARKKDDPRKQLEGTVISVSADTVYVDIGYKTEGILPLAMFEKTGETVKAGDKFPVSVKGRNPEGYYELSRTRVELPKDWSALERAFAEKTTIMGTVTGVIKGGLTVDVGVRAFMPGSRSGTRDAAEMEKMVGTEIAVRIIKLDVADEDLVVDRRAVLEEEARATTQRRFDELKEGDSVTGTVRSLTDYGAFVDLGGVDALLHVGDIGWSRVNKPGDVLEVGQQVEARVLKITTEGEKRRISIGMKQTQAHPWEAGAGKYTPGARVRGTVTRIVDFGAFVELEPGIEGLIHISELSWNRKIKRVSEVVKQGDTVEAVILGVKADDRRISLGLKQALGDPWNEVTRRTSVGSVVEGPIVSLTNFGAFVQIAEGVEGMIHVSEISAEKRINHPQDVLKVGQRVQAQVLGVDPEKRNIKLSIKQLVPTSFDEYVEEHTVGDIVSGRLIDVAGLKARVELGHGIQADCQMKEQVQVKEETKQEAKADLSSLSSMLQSKWKGTLGGGASKPEPVQAGQIRSFKIAKLDKDAKKIELELA